MKVISFPHPLGFALLHLLHNQDVQRKMQEELDFVFGDSLPSLVAKSR